MTKPIGILGSGGQADEVTAYCKDLYEVVFRAVSSEYLDAGTNRLIDLQSPDPHQAGLPVIAAVGAPAVRKKMIEQWPGKQYACLISDSAYIAPGTEIGQGSVVAPGSVITTNVKLGRHCLINVSATISHDSTLGDYVTVSPGAHLAGKVQLGDGVFVGIGATISNGVTIAAGCVIGAGTLVLQDITEENSIVVGVPGKVIKKHNGWLSEI